LSTKRRIVLIQPVPPVKRFNKKSGNARLAQGHGRTNPAEMSGLDFFAGFVLVMKLDKNEGNFILSYL
jgi:hypothetical protein